MVHALKEFCQRLWEEEEVRYVGIINQMGNLIAGGFKPGVEPYADYPRQHMMYMQLILELKMRREFDEVLGPVRYLHSRRQYVDMISIPKGKILILISATMGSDPEKLVNMAEKEYSKIQHLLEEFS